ncbi:hypothetical protein [Rheinheimera mangrovi]|uniref:hypothetical protein n=1 Tax=Rheinheimera mangrovi TaxID=2498451 RepID=UPI000F8CE7E2|nr:hypothetical protein [Rheinheimera mangrovi]
MLVNSERRNEPVPSIITAENKFRLEQVVNSQLGLLMDTQGLTYITLEQPGTSFVSKALRKLPKRLATQ